MSRPRHAVICSARSGLPTVPALPGLAIFLAVLSLHILGDALPDHLDPRMRHG